MVQIYTFLFKSIQILLYKRKCNTITLLQLQNVYTTFSPLYFISGRHHLLIAEGVRMLIFLLTLSRLFVGHMLLKLCHLYRSLLFFLFSNRTFFTDGGPSWAGIKIAINLKKLIRTLAKIVFYRSCSKECKLFQATNLEQI